MLEFNPEVFGKYYLIDKIATGGMAEIFRAKTYSHGGFEQTLVIKRILKHLGDNEDFVEMFIDEAKLSVGLQHANIIRIYDFGKMLDNYFIAMEWVDGKDVRNVLRKLAKVELYLPTELAALIAYEACRGLHYAHIKTDLRGEPCRIVHRDVSPSNLLVSYDGDVKVADFGIAKAKSNAGTTDVGVIKGKFDYMSPEQAEGQVVDHRSDLFAVGIVLYESLTGRRLFKAPTDVETLGRVKRADVPVPSSINPAIPAALDAVVMKALARDPADRYASGDAMAEALLECMHPATPDQLRALLGRYMHQLFATEIARERARLDEATQTAHRIHAATPAPVPYAQFGTNPTVSRSSTPEPQPRRGAVGFLLGGVLATALIGAASLLILGGLGLVGWTYRPAPPPPVAPITGSIDVMLLPGGQIAIDGEPVGEGEATIDGLPVGDHVVRVELAGYEPLEETVHVEAGKAVRFKRTLTAIPVAPVAPVAIAPARPAPVKPAPPPPPVDAPPVVAAAVEPGKVVVTLQGGGWADVWVDGVKQSKTAPLTLSLAPGSHTVKLVNASLGVDQTETIEVTAGATTRVVGKPR